MDFSELRIKIEEAKTLFDDLSKAVGSLDSLYHQYSEDEEVNFDEVLEMPSGFFKSVSMKKLQTQADKLLTAVEAINTAIQATYHEKLSDNQKQKLMGVLGVESEDDLKAIAKEREDARRQRKASKK